jgi:chemosensory pili system protein ChpA (sensor histidine kinase/response regulator)
MGRKVDNELLSGFVAEARGYLPAILKAISAFRADPADQQSLEPAQRLAHTIKGAASMIGLSALSQIAGYVEQPIDKAIASATGWSEAAFGLMQDMVGVVERYLQGVLEGVVDENALVAEAAGIHGRLQALMVSGSNPEGDVGAALRGRPLVGRSPTERTDCPPSFRDFRLAPLVVDAVPQEKPTPSGHPPEPPASSAKALTLEEELGSSDLKEIFAFEAEDHFRNISSMLPVLEREPGDKEVLQEIRRSVHSLKGSAGMVGFQNITRLAHRMEDLLDALYDGRLNLTAESMWLLHVSTDALEDIATGAGFESRSEQKLFEAYASLLEDGRGAAIRRDSSAGDEAAAELEIQAPIRPTQGVLGTAESGQTSPAGSQSDAVRVPIERLDELVRLASELMVTRNSFEQSKEGFSRQVQELQRSSDRLQSVASRLETQYEAGALSAGSLSLDSGPVVHGNRGLAVNPMIFNARDFDELELDRYTEFHLLSRELSENAADIHSLANEFTSLSGDFDAYLSQQSQLHSEIQERLMRARMVPLASLSHRFRRAVRNVAASQGKAVEFVLDGQDVEMDKTVLEDMADPLLHILRNAVDHGIDPEAVRRTVGKNPTGFIKLTAYYEGTQIVIRISDDGVGLDYGQLRAAAVAGGHISSDEAERMSDEELSSVIFRPGFSTAPRLSEVSGRGVGLDVVKATVNRLKGSIKVESRAGQGSTFTVRLPMTLAVMKALFVESNHEVFAVPLRAVSQVLRIDRDQLDAGDRNGVVIGEEVYPLMYLGRALGLRQPPDESVQRPPVLLVTIEGKEVAVVVDQMLGGREIVVKTLGNHLRRVRGVAGATLMGDGSVALILELADLAGVVGTQAAERYAGQTLAVHEEKPLSIMVVDDSPSVRRVLSNLIKDAGWNPVQAKDGVEALEVLNDMKDAPALMILDIEMPRMDGYEVLSTLRAQESHKNLPIVILTSRAGEKHREKAFELGATGYVVKPYQEEDLLSLIWKLTEQGEALDAGPEQTGARPNSD